MPPLTITTETTSDEGLLIRRQVQYGNHSLSTPTLAASASDRIGDTPSSFEGQCAVEVYRTISAQLLAKERKGDNTPVSNRLEDLSKQASDDELVVSFLAYKDGKIPSDIETPQIVELQADIADIISVPLMPELKGILQIEDEIDGELFENYLDFITEFIDLCQANYPEMPLMGVIPNLSSEHTNKILDIYLKAGVRAFCVNFDGAEVASQRSLETIQPLMNRIGRRGIERDVLVYSINAKSGGGSTDGKGRPADEICAAILGIDILGDYHVFEPLPEEVQEELSSEGEGETKSFVLFDKSLLTRREVPLAELPDELPEDSRFDAHDIIEDVKENGSKLGTYESLVETEQAAELLESISNSSSDDIFTNLSDKPGATTKVIGAAEEVRLAFNRGKEQTGLDEF